MKRSVSEIWNFLTITVGFRGLSNCCLDISLYSKKGGLKIWDSKCIFAFTKSKMIYHSSCYCMLLKSFLVVCAVANPNLFFPPEQQFRC